MISAKIALEDIVVKNIIGWRELAEPKECCCGIDTKILQLDYDHEFIMARRRERTKNS
ncbi:hypothetical protein [Pelolinea submarina]|uniref:hypothetical protein n=1 Tax=Pelolinea submarina TaxID=913107 RepID=UPI001319D224|nr:hypothetical protein [Pelolinea submarina]